MLTEDLMDSHIFQIWKKCREGIMIHIQSEKLTNEKRMEAKSLFKAAGIEMETVFLHTFKKIKRTNEKTYR